MAAQESCPTSQSLRSLTTVAKIIVKSAKFGIVVKELDTANYQDGAVLIRDLLQAIPDADWFEEKLDDDNAASIRISGVLHGR